MPNKWDYPRPVRSLVVRGFLSETTRVGPLRLDLKSLNGYEFSELEERFEGAERLTAFIAWSILRVDGEGALPWRGTPRETRLHRLAENLPSWIASRIVGLVSGLNEWASFESFNVLRFALEPDSKIAWRAAQGTAPNDPRLTGVPGTDRIGISEHQKLWAYYNDQAREERLADMLMDLGIVVAAPMAGKGIRRLLARRETEKRRREDFERRLKAGEHVGVGAKPDELLGLLDKEISGGKDEFDRIIEEEERRIGENVIKELLKKRLRYERRHALAPEVFLGEEELPDLLTYAKQIAARVEKDVKSYLQPGTLTETGIIRLVEEARTEVDQEPLSEKTYADRSTR